MGWAVHVMPVTLFVAVCDEALACPGPRTVADGARHEGQWTGPDRSNYEDAQSDAAEHYREHDRCWQEMNAEWDRSAEEQIEGRRE